MMTLNPNEFLLECFDLTANKLIAIRPSKVMDNCVYSKNIL